MSHILIDHTGGWKPSRPDHRRYGANTSGIPTLPEVDPRVEMPPIYNQKSLGSCFPAGTLIRMADGSERAIDDVRLAEHVVTAEGRTGMVRQTMVRLQTEGLVKLSLWGYGVLRLTAEHPVLTRRGYVRAGDLLMGDAIGLPRYSAPEIASINVGAVIAKHERMLKAGVRKLGGLPGRRDVAVRIASLPEEIILTERFGRLVGLFLAEGSTDSGKVRWTFGSHERETLVAETVDLLGDIGVDGYVQERSNNSINVVCYGTAWSRLWERLCGTGAGEKMITAQFASGPEGFRRGLLSGWLAGDGYANKRQGNHQRISGTSVSKRLALGLFDIAQALGMRPVLRRTKAQVNNAANKRRDFYVVEVPDRAGESDWRSEQDDTHVWRKVRALEQEEFAGFVYNLSIEGDESYVAEGIGVHNCTANATAAAFRYDAMLDGDDPGDLSRLWIYYQERKKENDLGQGDTGANGSDAFWAAQHVGICKEEDWPYDPTRYNDPAYFDPTVPPALATGDQTHYLLKKSYATPPLTRLAFQQVLSNKQTIAFGFSVYESFEGPDVAKTGIVPMPAQSESQIGGHEVLAVGYLKDEPNYFLVRNSWGTSWGLAGYFLMPVAYVLDPSLSGDWTTIVRSVA